MKKHMVLWGGAMFSVVCFSLYLMMETTPGSVSLQAVEVGENGLSSIDARIQQIETMLNDNQKMMNLIRETVQELAAGDQHSLLKLQKVLQMTRATLSPQAPHSVKTHAVSLPEDTCQLTKLGSSKADIHVLDVYDHLAFDNIDGGAWKQGFPIHYSSNKWEKRKLQVFVVPHSHNDPGWLKTFEKYYTDQTRAILNGMVDALERHPQLRFIYAEMSFFSMFWDEITQDKRQRVKKLLQENRLEIVAGGWVMNDEANAHYFAMLDQMIEGNQWLQQELGVKPKSGWAIDPFGHSPTMAYLLGKMGFRNMLIQRVHYSMKKHLAKNTQLEFVWRQSWDHTGSTDILCHLMPFYSYDIPHTCGPDPKVCCQFDFARLPGGRISCPWRVPPQVITDTNVAERASTLLDQYRQKATLYRNDVVFVPLGDDFRYDTDKEWDQQFTNYQRLFDYMNSQSEWQVEVKFATLSDYFAALRERAGVAQEDPPPQYPVLSGDFYTYADRDDHYWSGYFTSRPFYKRLNRVMESHLRGAELLFSQAVIVASRTGANVFVSDLMKMMVAARRSLALFQHHDGITGTAREIVVADYGQKLLTAIQGMKKVIMHSAELLLSTDPKRYTYTADNSFFDVDETRASHDSLPVRTVLQVGVGQSRCVTLYNSLGHARQTVVRLFVSTPHIQLKDSLSNVVPCQVDPFWNEDETVSNTVYKLVFVAKVPAFGLSTYTLHGMAVGESRQGVLANVHIYNSAHSGLRLDADGVFTVARKASMDDVTLENSQLKVTFSQVTGLMDAVQLKSTGERVSANMQFVKYGAKPGKECSGAYLFLPDGAAKPLTYSHPVVRVVSGDILSEVHVLLPGVQHIISLHNSPGIDGQTIDVSNTVDIRNENDIELAMRIQTNIRNENSEFYTDLNGFQMQKRKTLSKLPLQGNFYPMPAMAYLESDKIRMSILSAQSLGVASLKTGWLEVMQDRRLSHDDNRGLGQGVRDNKRTPNKFSILVEIRKESSTVGSASTVGFPSLLSHLASQELVHHMHVLPAHVAGPPTGLRHNYTGLTTQLPCDIHLLNLRTLQSTSQSTHAALLLHRLGVDCGFPTYGVTCQCSSSKVNLAKLFSAVKVQKASPTSLTLTNDGAELSESSQLIDVPQMEIRAYKLQLT